MLQIDNQHDDEHTRKLLDDLDNPNSPVRVVVSVDKLKEGWDTKRIAVMCTLRAMASDVLTQQTMGRGLRLPFGTPTGYARIDQLDILAHTSFEELLNDEDILETFFLNLFHGGRLAAMPPKLMNDEGDMTVLRPLAYCAEADLARFAEAMAFPIIPCDLCGSQDGLQRNAMKAMLQDIERRMPGRKDTMIRALANVRPSHLLDRSLFDFAAIGLTPA